MAYLVRIQRQRAQSTTRGWQVRASYWDNPRYVSRFFAAADHGGMRGAGAHPAGMFSTVTCQLTSKDGEVNLIDYVRTPIEQLAFGASAPAPAEVPMPETVAWQYRHKTRSIGTFTAKIDPGLDGYTVHELCEVSAALAYAAARQAAATASLRAENERLLALDRPRVDKLNALVIQGARDAEQIAALTAAVERVRGVLRELVAVRDIEEKYSQSRPDSPYARNWSQFVADTSGLRQRSDRAWAAARAELGGRR